MNVVTLVGLVVVEVLLLVFIVSLLRARDTIGRRGDSLIAFLAAFFIWAALNYFSNVTSFDHDTILLINRLLFASSVLIAACAWGFMGAVTGRANGLSRLSLPYILLGLTAVIISFTPLVVSNVYDDGTGVIAVEFGSLLWLYGLSVVLFLLTGIYWLATSLRSRNRRVRSYAKALFISVGGATTVIVMTNFVIPVVFNNFSFSTLGPLVSVVIIGGVSYSITQHNLFDIKAAVARSTAYALVLTTLAFIYYGVAYAASIFIFGGNVNAEMSVSPFNVVLALMLAFLFQPIKRFFDKFTNKLFYKDGYSASDFYNSLNSIVRSTTKLQILLSKSADLINHTLKSEFVSFFIYSNQGSLISAGAGKYRKIPIGDVREFDTARDIISVDDREISAETRRLMLSHKVSVLVPLYQNNQPVGIMCLGEHRTLKYSQRDYRVLHTTAGELVIGIQNAMSVEEIRDLNATLQQRIDAATKELRRSNAQLQRLDEAKDEFISMASHQLRTPLTSIKGYISMLIEGDLGQITKEQTHVLNEAFISSERMVRLIGDFLNVSRLQTGKFSLEKRSVDLAKLIKRELEALEANADARGIKFVYKMPKDIPELEIDENKVEQVIMNFCDNAIFYSKDNSKINVTLEKVGDWVEFKVIDTGIGVPKEEQGQLFNKFFRATNARKARPDGTGVGIFLAKKVILEHGGTLIFESKENKGSTFGFRLQIPGQ